MRIWIRYLIVAVGVLIVGAAAVAQPPPDLNYQGKLLDSAGEPLLGPVDIEVRVFDQLTDGTQLYREFHQNVPLGDGVFGILLGTGDFQEPAGGFDEALFDAQNRFLEVLVDGETLEPRQPFSSVAYAFQSEAAQTALFALEADRVDGLDASDLDQSAHVGDTANPHGVTAAQLGAATSGDVDAAVATHSGNASAHHERTTSFGELVGQASDGQIPDTITRDSELDAGLAKKSDVGHDHGQTLGDLNCTTDQIAKWNGSAWACARNHVSGIVRGSDASILAGANFTVTKLGTGRYQVNATGLKSPPIPVPVVTSFWATPTVPTIFSVNSSGQFIVHFFRLDDGSAVDPFAWTFVYTDS